MFSDKQGDTQECKTTEKTYTCPLCQCQCVNRAVYIRHIGKKHQTGGGSIDEQEDIFRSSYTDENDRVIPLLRDLYLHHRHEMNVEHFLGEVHADYNYPIGDGRITYEEIRDHLMQIYENENQVFKLNISFGVVLRNVSKEEYTYFHPVESDSYIRRPAVISSRYDIQKLLDLLKEMDLLEKMAQKRKNTKWIFHGIANVVYFVNRMDYPIGAETEEVSEFIIKSRSIYALVKNRTGKKYTDKLCIFRCLSLHKGKSIRCLEKTSKNYFKQWLKFIKVKKNKFEGVKLHELHLFEKFFKLNINVFELKKCGVAVPVYKSHCDFETTMYCNLFGHHFSFIKNFRRYAKKY